MRSNPYLYWYSQTLSKEYEPTAARERLLKEHRPSLRLRTATGLISFAERLEPNLRDLRQPRLERKRAP